jgi:hypothetical protein
MLSKHIHWLTKKVLADPPNSLGLAALAADDPPLASPIEFRDHLGEMGDLCLYAWVQIISCQGH